MPASYQEESILNEQRIMKRVLVFVYGTLRMDGQYHDFLSDATLVLKQCYLYGRMFDTGSGYPAITLEPHYRIYGELYEVNNDTLALLDQLEDYESLGKDNLYNRVIQKVYVGGKAYQAFVYVYASVQACTQFDEIISGDWITYHYNKER
jgi:gamma-glutamylcyclotransferase (GGCT)/AIG2-like uncharacterized protein YtfP